jgi:arylsulfatase A-like enzyme
VAAGPGIEPGRLQAPVRAVDLTATLLTWMDAPLPERMEGAPVPRLTARGRA